MKNKHTGIHNYTLKFETYISGLIRMTISELNHAYQISLKDEAVDYPWVYMERIAVLIELSKKSNDISKISRFLNKAEILTISLKIEFQVPKSLTRHLLNVIDNIRSSGCKNHTLKAMQYLKYQHETEFIDHQMEYLFKSYIHFEDALLYIDYNTHKEHERKVIKRKLLKNEKVGRDIQKHIAKIESQILLIANKPSEIKTVSQCYGRYQKYKLPILKKVETILHHHRNV